MSRLIRFVIVTLIASGLMGCTSEDIPQAHKGRMFDRTGALALYTGGEGFIGPVLQPGTYWTGVYDQLRTIDCSQQTMREPLESLTKDGVQFKLDVYITFSSDCSDKAVIALLDTLTPDKGGIISGDKVYVTYIRPAIGEAVRETISPHRANDVNEKREQILEQIRERFINNMSEGERRIVNIHDTVLSNLDYPDAMDQANTERAVQAVLKDKAIAERERVTAEIETMKMREDLARSEGQATAAKIDEIGAALQRNPGFLQYDLQSKMPEIYRDAGVKGNMVITAPSPQVLVNGK